MLSKAAGALALAGQGGHWLPWVAPGLPKWLGARLGGGLERHLGVHQHFFDFSLVFSRSVCVSEGGNAEIVLGSGLGKEHYTNKHYPTKKTTYVIKQIMLSLTVLGLVLCALGCRTVYRFFAPCVFDSTVSNSRCVHQLYGPSDENIYL